MLNDPAEDELGVHSTGLGQGLMIQESIFQRDISKFDFNDEISNHSFVRNQSLAN
jgi:hypothetical protein